MTIPAFAVSTALDSEGWVPHADETFIAGLGKVYERRRDGLLEIGLQTGDTHRNRSGVVHGGVVMALLDRVMGFNCREAAGGIRMATASLTVNFTRPISIGDFIALACKLRRVGRNAVFADGEAWVGEQIVATATGVWMRVGRPAPSSTSQEG